MTKQERPFLSLGPDGLRVEYREHCECVGGTTPSGWECPQCDGIVPANVAKLDDPTL
jgi:hypothetical protein